MTTVGQIARSRVSSVPMRRTRSKTGESVKARVKRFFAANPGEELTYADMKQKFDCSYTSVTRAAAELKREGLVDSFHVVRAKAKGAW